MRSFSLLTASFSLGVFCTTIPDAGPDAGPDADADAGPDAGPDADAELEVSLSVGRQVVAATPSLADVTLLLATSLASEARRRLGSSPALAGAGAGAGAEALVVANQILSISLAAASAGDAAAAKTLVKEAALKAVTGKLLGLQSAFSPAEQFPQETEIAEAITDLGLAIVAEPHRAGELLRDAALAFATEKTQTTLPGFPLPEVLAVVQKYRQDPNDAKTAAEAAAGELASLLLPGALRTAKTRLPVQYHGELELVSGVALAVATDPTSAQEILTAALKKTALAAAKKAAIAKLSGETETTALELLQAAEEAKTAKDLGKKVADLGQREGVELVDRKFGAEAGRATHDIVTDLRQDVADGLITRGTSGATRLGLTGPAELELTRWGKVTKCMLRCVPFCRRATRGRVKGEAGEVLELVGDVVVDLAGKTLLQFVYFDLRSELVEASKALVAINKQTKPQTLLTTYKPYTDEQLAQDLEHFVLSRIARVLGEYEVRKKEDRETATLLESVAHVTTLMKLQQQLDHLLDEQLMGDSILDDWPEIFVLSKRTIDAVALRLEEVMAQDAAGGCVFACCGSFWVKQPQQTGGGAGDAGAGPAAAPLLQETQGQQQQTLPEVRLKMDKQRGLGKAVAKAAESRDQAKQQYYLSRAASTATTPSATPSGAGGTGSTAGGTAGEEEN